MLKQQNLTPIPFRCRLALIIHGTRNYSFLPTSLILTFTSICPTPCTLRQMTICPYVFHHMPYTFTCQQTHKTNLRHRSFLLPHNKRRRIEIRIPTDNLIAPTTRRPLRFTFRHQVTTTDVVPFNRSRTATNFSFGTEMYNLRLHPPHQGAGTTEWYYSSRFTLALPHV